MKKRVAAMGRDTNKRFPHLLNYGNKSVAVAETNAEPTAEVDTEPAEGPSVESAQTKTPAKKGRPPRTTPKTTPVPKSTKNTPVVRSSGRLSRNAGTATGNKETHEN